jgi:hypothetical protein
MIKIEVRKPEKLNSKQSAFISFPYDGELITLMRNESIRHYDYENKVWELPASRIAKFINVTKQTNMIEIVGKYEIDKLTNEAIPESFKFKTTPFNHQIEGLEHGMKNDCFILADEQGVGKTKQVIDIAIANKIKYGYKHCLIVCGVNGLKWNWKDEISIHSNETGYILGTRWMPKAKRYKIGSSEDRLYDLNNLPDDYFIITNIETLRYTKRVVIKAGNKKMKDTTPIADKIMELCETGVFGISAIDEIHKCFEYNTLVNTDIGLLKIGDIVKHKMNVKVPSFNEDTNSIEYKKIINHYENIIAEPLLKMTFEVDGKIKEIKCTKDHKFFTQNRGWVEAQHLIDLDILLDLN